MQFDYEKQSKNMQFDYEKQSKNVQLAVFLTPSGYRKTNRKIEVSILIIVIISMVSVTLVGGYFFLRKRKENI